jgi:chaperonin GroES
MTIKLTPLADRVVIMPVRHFGATVNGIYIPESAREKSQEGIVLAVGAGQLLDNGLRQLMSIRSGDTVLYDKYAGTEYTIGDETYLICAEKDILAVIDREGT